MSQPRLNWTNRKVSPDSHPVKAQPFKAGPLVLGVESHGKVTPGYIDGRLAVRVVLDQLDVTLSFETEEQELEFAKRVWAMARAKRR